MPIIRASVFLAALDKDVNVTQEHPYFLEKGKELIQEKDDVETNSDINPAVLAKAQFARECEARRRKLSYEFPAMSARMIFPAFVGIAEMVIQLFRPFLLVFFACLPLLDGYILRKVTQTYSPESILDSPSFHTFRSSPISIIALSAAIADYEAVLSFINTSMTSFLFSEVLNSPVSSLWSLVSFSGQWLYLHFMLFLMKYYLPYAPYINTLSLFLTAILLLSLRYDVSLQRSCCNRRSAAYEGMYYNPNSPLTSAITKECHSLTVKGDYKPTPYLFSGDWLTVVPFGLFACPPAKYERRYVRLVDQEAVALDWSFPKLTTSMEQSKREMLLQRGIVPGETYFDPSKPIIIVLHGLNGGSTEGYVLDLMRRATKKGYTAVCMIARGLMGTHIVHGHTFHGGRLTDVESATKTIRQALNRLGESKADNAPEAKHTRVGMVGYSMGGIIGSNYCAQMGDKANIDCCVAFSAVYDYRHSLQDEQARRVWQPIIALALKTHMIYQQQHWFGKPLFAKIDLKKVETLRSLQDFDTYVTSKLAEMNSVEEYYSAISCGTNNKLDNLRVPLLLVSAEDDPLISIDTLTGAPDAARSSPHLMVKITKSGGHVGWPTGWNPLTKGWEYMNETALDYIQTTVTILDRQKAPVSGQQVEIKMNAQPKIKIETNVEVDGNVEADKSSVQKEITEVNVGNIEEEKSVQAIQVHLPSPSST